MARLNFKDLDQWIVDLDLLQQELKTMKTHSSDTQRDLVNGLRKPGHTVERTTATSSSMLPASSNATSAQIATRHQILRPGQSNSSKHQIVNPIIRDSSHDRYHSPSYSTELSGIYEHDLYEPIGNGYDLGYAKHNVNGDHYLATNAQMNGNFGHPAHPIRAVQPKEQKSVHWPSELKSSPNSPAKHVSNPRNYGANQFKTETTLSMETPIQMHRHRGPQVEHPLAIGKTSFQEKSREPKFENSIAPPRSDIIVRRTHTFNPFETKPVRSATVPSNLAFPLTLADLKSPTTQEQTTSHDNHTSRSSRSILPAGLENTISYTRTPVAIPFTKISTRHSQADSQPRRRLEQQHNLDPTVIPAPTSRGVTRSQSAVHYSLTESEPFASDTNLHKTIHGSAFLQHKTPPIQSPITVHDESRISWGLDGSIKDLKTQVHSNGADNHSHDRIMVRVYYPNRSSKSVAIEASTTAMDVIETLVERNKLPWSTKYALVEKVPSQNLERVFEDDELIMTCLCNWRVSCENLLFFEEREDIYGMVENPQLWFDENLLPSESRNNEDILKTFFGRNKELRLPTISEYLYVQTNGSVWKRRYCLFKNSSLYMNKQPSKEISSFRQMITIKPFLHVYTTTGMWSKQHSPTPYGFTLKSCSSSVTDKPVKIQFCAPNENSLRTWYSLIRIALTGQNILKNYAYRKKLTKSNLPAPSNIPHPLPRNALESCNKNQRDNQPIPFSTAHGNKPIAVVDSTPGLNTKLSVYETEQNNTSSTNSPIPPPANSPDADATGADASSIAWSTNESGGGGADSSTGAGALTVDTDDDLDCVFDRNVRCTSERIDVRGNSHSTTDLVRAVELRPSRPSCTNSLTSLFSCAINDKKNRNDDHLPNVQNCNESTKRGRTRSIKKRFFGFGPSARRCCRSVTHISAPFNVSVPSWVRSSMNDLSRSTSISNSMLETHPK